MPDRASKRSKSKKDLNQNAFGILQQITTEDKPEAKLKNPAAVALGRLGGLRGGKARAAKLSEKKLKQIAKKAAKARWKNHKKRSQKSKSG